SVVAGTQHVEPRVELRVIAQEQHISLGAHILDEVVAHLGALYRHGELERLATAEEISGLGGDPDVGGVEYLVPPAGQSGGAAVRFEVIGKDDGRVRSDSHVPGVSGSDSTVSLRQRLGA